MARNLEILDNSKTRQHTLNDAVLMYDRPIGPEPEPPEPPRVVHLHEEEIRRGAEQVEDRNSRDYWQEKNHDRAEKDYEKKTEAKREREHQRSLELARERRQPAQPGNRTMVHQSSGRSAHPFNSSGIDFSSSMISSNVGGASGYASPFRGVGGMGQSMFPKMSVGKMSGGLFGKQSVYADPFRASGKMLTMNSGIFAKGSATNSLTQGIFSGSGVSLFGSLTRAAPKKRSPAKKKPAAKRGEPKIYGNSAAVRRKVVVAQNGKKVKVTRLPKRRQTRR